MIGGTYITSKMRASRESKKNVVLRVSASIFQEGILEERWKRPEKSRKHVTVKRKPRAILEELQVLRLWTQVIGGTHGGTIGWLTSSPPTWSREQR